MKRYIKAGPDKIIENLSAALGIDTAGAEALLDFYRGDLEDQEFDSDEDIVNYIVEDAHDGICDLLRFDGYDSAVDMLGRTLVRELMKVGKVLGINTDKYDKYL